MLSFDLKLALHADHTFSLDVAMEVPVGISCLCGPSGAGKSLTLQALSGLLRPDSGHITCNNKVLYDSSKGIDIPPEHRRTSLVFQSLALFPHLTALENTCFGIRTTTSREQKLDKARHWLAQMHAEHLTHRYPVTFSGGEAQRVALARALAAEPEILLLDEPFAALDVGLRKTISLQVEEVVRSLGIPCILVTHDLSEARDLALRVWTIHAGTIVVPTAPGD